jgi:hypothetical protein
MRNKTARQLAVKPILKKLTELHLSPVSYLSIKLLYQQLQVYIQTGERIELNIPFMEYNCTIKGLLTSSAQEQVWVKLEAQKDKDKD